MAAKLPTLQKFQKRKRIFVGCQGKRYLIGKRQCISVPKTLYCLFYCTSKCYF